MLEQAQTPVIRQSQLEGFPIECLTCYQLSHSNKIRLGKNYDGGYVIVDGFPTMLSSVAASTGMIL